MTIDEAITQITRFEEVISTRGKDEWPAEDGQFIACVQELKLLLRKERLARTCATLRIEALTRALRDDYELDVHWDGLRKFWDIGLTEEGCATRDRAFRAEGENVALREVIRMYAEYTDQDRCLGCACKGRCDEGEVDECWMLKSIREQCSELGIEVD